ncbi:MAG: hypothetical protein QOI38_3119 [Sphingomonadales bacterium]|jgi:hypothetical protein|nr:hypothetical protein [Sphingomonadales bacterium]
MTVDAAQAQWLRDGAVFAVATDAAIAAAWGEDALETRITSPLALAAGASAEATRQQDFLEGPFAIETHDVPGLRSDLLGRPVTLTSSHLGYDAGLIIFVLGVDEQERVERTTLTVLRKLT